MPTEQHVDSGQALKMWRLCVQTRQGCQSLEGDMAVALCHQDHTHDVFLVLCCQHTLLLLLLQCTSVCLQHHALVLVLHQDCSLVDTVCHHPHSDQA